jgi:hypothetical protein
VISIAAVFTGLLGFFIVQPTTTSNRDIFKTYTDIRPSRIELVRVEDPLRGEEYIIPGLPMTDSEFAKDGLNFYEKNDYLKATLAFQKIQDLKDYPEIMIYHSIAQLKIGQTSEAINNLLYLSNLKNFKSAELSKYYLSLGYINAGKILKARKILKNIVEDKGEYSMRASKMLSSMRWF